MKRTITTLFLGLIALVCFPCIAPAQDGSSSGIVNSGAIIASNNTVSLTSGVSSDTTGGLFLQNLILDGGSSLVISNNTALYFVTRDSSYDEGGVYLQLISAGSVHVLELTVPESVPEPATWLLVCLSAGALLGFHRRN